MTSTPSDKPYCDYRQFLRQRYGQTIYRIPIDLGLGCPHRSGAEGQHGCIYCGDSGARAAHLRQDMSPREQVEAGISLAGERYAATGFLAYLQAFTATNAPTDELRRLYSEVLGLAAFKGIIIATRPDCLPADTVDYLSELRQSIDVWVELGVQTAHDDTLKHINRGHDFGTSVAAVETLAARGIEVAAHVILGLPGEAEAHFQHTAAQLAQLPLTAVKVHNLHVVEGTALAEMWRRGKVSTWDEHEYAEVLMDFLRRVPRTWPVMRFVCDTPKELLLAPRWWLTKAEFMQYLERQMRERGWEQGDLCGDNHSSADAGESRRGVPVPLMADSATDGSVRAHTTRRAGTSRTAKSSAESGGTAHSADPDVDERFTLWISGLLESLGIADPQRRRKFTIFDIGFGLSRAPFAAVDAVPAGAGRRLRIVGFALEPGAISSMQTRVAAENELLQRLATAGRADADWGGIRVFHGDPRRNMLRARGKVRIILLEPVDTERHVQVFTLDFLRRITRVMAPSGVLLSPATASAFRGALLRLGMEVGKCPAGLLQGGGTVATWDRKLIKEPLSAKERRIAERTLSGVPYRDPDFNWSRKRILQHRQDVRARLRLRGWAKRPS